ncbi:MAG: pyridoxamine 5'-phosphate oxidase family protein [Beijerinckiaceae bacterium]
MARIPSSLWAAINTAYPDNTVLIGSVLPDGFAQFTPRGSVYVYDDEHFAMWERGLGTTNENLRDGSKLTVFFRNMNLRESGLLPRGGIARFYGTARLVKEGAERDRIYNGIIKHEQARDPEKKGFGVVIKVERAEHIDGKPLTG